ncbi:MAG: aminotransferase class V-fold PLP-dependent enzyme [Cyclobacteriaceae bacterium]
MKCQREKFNLQRKYAYLNCAYMSPLSKKVEKAGITGIRGKRKPFHITPADFFKDTETLRTLFAKLINASDKDRCVVIPSVSYGMAIVSKNLRTKPGDNIVITGEQFPSNVYPWLAFQQKDVSINSVDPPETATHRGENWNKAILEAIDEKTRLVAIGHVHWSDGTLFDLKAIREKTREVGALLVIDGTQSVGALPFDVAEIEPDALIVAGYKWLMGPYSIGMAYFGAAFDEGQPLEENWINRTDSENFNDLINYKLQYQHGALRYDVGEHSNFVLVPMLIAGIKQLLHWTPAGIQQYCERLISPYLDEISAYGGHVEEATHRANHLVGIRYPELDHVRAGKIFRAHKVSVSIRGNAIRIAPHVYNDAKDMRKLMKALSQI